MKGKKVTLRALEPEDIDFLYALENDAGIWQLSNTRAPFSRYILEQYILNAHQDIYTAKQLRLIISKSGISGSFSVLGAIDLFDFDPANKRAGIGIVVSGKEQNKGYATEALQLLINYCFNTLYLHQVYCNITTDNAASLHLFGKFGFEITGCKKEWLYQNGCWVDEYTLQLINRKE